VFGTLYLDGRAVGYMAYTTANEIAKEEGAKLVVDEEKPVPADNELMAKLLTARELRLYRRLKESIGHEPTAEEIRAWFSHDDVHPR
jgi:hypothetical protein